MPTHLCPVVWRLHPSHWTRDCQLFKKHQGPLPPVDILHPSLHFPVHQSKGCCRRHLSCLPSRQTSLCAQGAGCHGNSQFPFQWGLAAGASPFSGVSQSRSHQATHCFLRTCLEPLIMGSDPLSGAVPQQEAWGRSDLRPPQAELCWASQLEQGPGTCPPQSPLVPTPWPTSLVCHTHTLSFPASGRCPFHSVWGCDRPRP